MTSSALTLRTLVAHISDTHIRRPGELAYGIVDTGAALARCVTFLNSLAFQPDILVVSGDLVDFGRAEEYAHFRKLMAPLTTPYVILPGNHDELDAMRHAFPDHPYFSTEGPLNARIFANDLCILLLDSSVPGQPYGILSDRTLRWLEAQLREHPAYPTLIFLHHPPFLTGIQHMDVQSLRNTDALASVLQGRQQVRLLAAGHVHRTILSLFEGLPAVIAPGTSHAVAFDLDPAGPPAFQLETPGLYLHAWMTSAEAGRLISHALPIGDFDGPFPFFDDRGRLL